ncbi:PAS domain-containing protein [Rubricoccus marinus]|uniref:PAS domain-containing protein n=1 Tax=Rubricoccus marinus TaxID=716817 RepID=UPI00117B2ADE|nr:PAS domain-containing protein [Rubricoccus marinus]
MSLPHHSALDVALRQSAALLQSRGLYVLRLELDGHVQAVASTGESLTQDAMQVALAALVDDGELSVVGATIGVDVPHVEAVWLGDERHALLALCDAPIGDWHLSEAGALVSALIYAEYKGVELDHARFLRALTADPAPLDERLHNALTRASSLLGLEAAVFLCVESEEWNVESVHDPGGIVNHGRLLASGALASITFRASGSVGIHDVAASAFAAPGEVGAFLGAPIVAGGQGLGVLAFLGREARPEPFGPPARELVETLARWAGAALGGRASAQRLAEQEATLSRLFYASPYPVGVAEWRTAPGEPDDLELVEANESAVRMLGAGPGDTFSEVLPPAAVRLWTGACRRATVDESVQRFRADLVPPGETEARRYRVSLSLITAPTPERPGRVTFLAEDVTARRHIRDNLHGRESQLRIVLEHAPILLFELDEAGHFVFCEGRALALSGIRSEDLIGVSAVERYRNHPETMQGFNRVLSGQASSWTLTLGSREFEVYAEPSRDRDNAISGARGVAVDVTERRNAERIAARASEEAADDARHSADLVSLLSHGLRVPLATVLGYADLMEDEDGEAAEAAGAITRAAQEILDTLDGFLDLTQLSALRTVAPRPTGTTGLEATVNRAVAEGASGVPVSVEVVPLETPILLDLSLFGAVISRVAELAEGSLEVSAEAAGAHLFVRLFSPGLASRLGGDSLDTAYVHHAVAALDAELALGADGSVGIGVPVLPAPIVHLATAPSGDGSLRAAELITRL